MTTNEPMPSWTPPGYEPTVALPRTIPVMYVVATIAVLLALASAVLLGTKLGHHGTSGPSTVSTQWTVGYNAGERAVEASIAEGDSPATLSAAVGDREQFCQETLTSVGVSNPESITGCVAGITAALNAASA